MKRVTDAELASMRAVWSRSAKDGLVHRSLDELLVLRDVFDEAQRWLDSNEPADHAPTALIAVVNAARLIFGGQR